MGGRGLLRGLEPSRTELKKNPAGGRVRGATGAINPRGRSA